MFPRRCRTILESEGIDVRARTPNASASRAGEAAIVVGVDCAEASRQVVGSHVLLAVGRRPNTDDLGLDKAGVATDARGYIKVDDQLRTNVPGIWALGDCNGRGAFTHTAYNDYRDRRREPSRQRSTQVSDRIPTYALFIDPPLGRAGMTEAEVRATGRRRWSALVP